MSTYKISESKSKYAITRIKSFLFNENWNDARCLSKFSNLFLKEFYIKEKNCCLQINQLTTSSIFVTDLQKLMDENDYQTCIEDARMIESSDKSLFCPNFYHVFYAELELNLNRFFTENSNKQWSLLFMDYNFMPPVQVHNFDAYAPFQIFIYEPHILTILHNAKVKYCCIPCGNEWTTARGRAIFQAEIPEINKYNVLFAYLFTQKCQICHQDIEPSWYVDEATRVMKNICRILIDMFYSHEQFLSTSSRSSSPENNTQRISDMRNPHYQNLCEACQEGSCFISHWQYQQNR